MKILKRITAFILVFCLLMSVTLISASAADTVKIEFKGTYDYTEAYKVLDIVNQERAKVGLSALTMDTDLLEAAMQRAAECSIYYNHTRPDGTSCFTAFPSKFTYGSRAENIAAGYVDAADVMDGWMNSSGHKGNILNSNFSSIGIGCFYQNGYLYWVQLFSTVKASSPSTRPTNKVVTASASVLLEQLYLDYKIIEAEEPNERQFILYNHNAEFYKDPIQLENTTITYTSNNKNILDVTSSGLIKSTSDGIAKLSCYIDGTLAFEPELTFGHKHEYKAVVTEPTCTERGYTTYTCKYCDDSYIGNETKPIAHDYNSVITKPTCTEGGFTTYTCKDCGYSYVGNETKPIAHDYNSVITKPTCTTGGFTTYTCKDCGDSYVGNKTDPAPHNYNVVVTKPTYTEGGFTTYTCKDCGYSYIGDETPALSHNYVGVVTKPTCTSEGYTTYTCKDCGDSYIADKTEPVPHNYSIVVTAPTCTAGGYTTYTCKNCSNSYTANQTKPVDHSYKAIVTAPTCTAGGYTTYTCKNCGNSYTANGTMPVPHDYKVTAIPNGNLYECKNCDHSYQETVTAPEKLLGDIDGDGKVSNSDLVAIARYIVGLEKSIDLSVADIDKSGNITNSDLVAVARHIVGLE